MIYLRHLGVKIIFIILASNFLRPTIIKAESIFINPKLEEMAEEITLSAKIRSLNSINILVGENPIISKFYVKKGQWVKKGDILAKSLITYALSNLSVLESQHAFLLKELSYAKRMVELSKQKLNDKKIFIQRGSESSNQLSAANINVVQSQLNLSQIEKRISDHQKEIDAVKKLIKNSTYYTPIDGVITYLPVDPRQLVGNFSLNPYSVLAKIEKNEDYVAEMLTLDNDIGSINIGESGPITLDGETERIPCKIVSKFPLFKKGYPKGLFSLSCTFHKKGPILNAGRMALFRKIVRSQKLSLTLPWNAIKLEPDKAIVKVRKKGAGDSQSIVTEERVVQLGMRRAEKVEIKTGLHHEDEVEAVLW